MARRIVEDDGVWDIGDDSYDNRHVHAWHPMLPLPKLPEGE